MLSRVFRGSHSLSSDINLQGVSTYLAICYQCVMVKMATIEDLARCHIKQVNKRSVVSCELYICIVVWWIPN